MKSSKMFRVAQRVELGISRERESAVSTYRPSFLFNKDDDESRQEKNYTQKHQQLMNLK